MRFVRWLLFDFTDFSLCTMVPNSNIYGHTRCSIIVYFGGYFRISSCFGKNRPKNKKQWLWIFTFLFALLVILWDLINTDIFTLSIRTPEVLIQNIYTFFIKHTVEPGRFLGSAITFGFLYLSVTFSWKRINQLFSWLILPFGENSLLAYSTHVILAIAYHIIAFSVSYFNESYWLNGLFQLIGVLLTWGLVKSRFFVSTRSKKKFFYAVPLLLIITYLILSVAV